MSASEAGAPAPTPSSRLWIGYAMPMVIFAALTSVEGWTAIGLPYPLLYTFKVLAVSAALYMSRKVWKDIRVDRKVIVPGLLIGLLVFIEWIVVDRYTPHFMGKRTAFNPKRAIDDPTLRMIFIAIRFYGLAIMVPVMEELFWRSFLLRWITDQDFTALELNAFSWSAFGIVGAAFAFSHPEWLAAALCAVLYGLLLKKTNSLFSCVMAHAFTNLLLGIYIMTTGAWSLW